MENVIPITHNLTAVAYYIYLPLTLLLTWYVAYNLFKSGKLFMLDIFRQNELMAQATNQLFKVGFYLVACGYALLQMPVHYNKLVSDKQDLLEVLSSKVGWFAFFLGFLLFVNLMLFFRGRKRAMRPVVVQEPKANLPAN